ncbi:LPS translocon maturation chaperone LptM [Aestuariivirga litoralis]|nr:lipoprotein [Aestuariivirga litoralis]
MKAILLIVAVSLTLAACGIKGDPLPPKTPEPQQAQ